MADPDRPSGQAFGVGPGMRLSASFFHEEVEPLADARLGRGTYAAALLGQGSEVLGLDTEMSADHDWGPRVTLFVEPSARSIAASIAAELPASFGGMSRSFGSAGGGAPWVHPFEVATVPEYFEAWIGFCQPAEATLLEWLSTPAMSFLAVTAGAVFHDGPGDLTRAREAAGWYPDDVWRWLVACQWRRIGEEQPFVERAAIAGDVLGARVVAARLVREAMRLALLLERHYAPYSKWLGSAFATLPVADRLQPSLSAALDTPTGGGPRGLCDALEVLGSITNQCLGVSVDPSPRQFHTRPIHVAPAEEFCAAVLAKVADERLRALPTNAGNVDMLFGTNNGGFPGARAAYEALLSSL